MPISKIVFSKSKLEVETNITYPKQYSTINFCCLHKNIKIGKFRRPEYALKKLDSFIFFETMNKIIKYEIGLG